MARLYVEAGFMVRGQLRRELCRLAVECGVDWKEGRGFLSSGFTISGPRDALERIQQAVRRFNDETT